MDFLDEEAFEPTAPDGGPSRRRGTPERRRQFLVRRLIGLGALILILILIVLGIKGCLNARKQRSYENYVSDVSSVVTQTKQLSTDFFGQLSNPGKLSDLAFEQQISADRGTAEGLLNTLSNISVPGNLGEAQSQMILAYELRRDGLDGINANIKAALGTGPGRTAALDAIARYMRYFLASDVLYERAKTQVDSVLSDEGIEVNGKPAKLPESVFMDDPLRWLDPLQISSALAAVAGAKNVTPGTHGLALSSTTVTPGNVVLSTDTPTTVSGSGPYTLTVGVQNQGTAEESNVIVTFQITGGPQTIEGQATIPKIVAGGTATADLRIGPNPPPGQPVNVEVTVQPVPGEQIEDNNRATYPVTFGG